MVMALRRLVVLSLLLLVSAPVPARAEPPIPALTGRVVDTAGVLSSSTIDRLTTRLQNYEATTTNQVVVVTLPDLKGYPIEDWGLALGRGWGIGQKDKNNGVLLIVAPNDRQLRIEVGYGLEGQLPDATADKIIRYEIVPRFKGGDVDGGVIAGVNAIITALGGNYTPSVIEEKESSKLGAILPVVMCAMCMLVLILINVRRRWNPSTGRYYWGLRPDNGGYSAGRGFSSGDGFSSHSSGGGFSGGGGSFGGGGASGRW